MSEAENLDLDALDSIDALLEEAEQAMEEGGETLSSAAPAVESGQDALLPDPEPDGQNQVAEPVETAADSSFPPSDQKASSDSDFDSELKKSQSGPESALEETEALPDIDEVLQPTPRTVDEFLPDGPEDAASPSQPASGATEHASVTATPSDPVSAAASSSGNSAFAMPPSRKGQNELSARDMDTLKKYILIFGITLVVMALIGWGLTIWAAVAASSAHLDEETTTVLEEIKTGMEHLASVSGHQKKAFETVEKKMDALNYQLEQINTDLGKLETLLAQSGGTAPAHETPRSAHGRGRPHEGHHGGSGGAHSAEAASHGGRAATAQDGAALALPDMKKTLASINSRVIRTQKKVEQVYARLLKVQGQYRAVLSQLKAVQQALLAQKRTDRAGGSQAPSHASSHQGHERHEGRRPHYESENPTDMDDAYRYPGSEAGAYDPVYINSYP